MPATEINRSASEIECRREAAATRRTAHQASREDHRQGEQRHTIQQILTQQLTDRLGLRPTNLELDWV
jgi:hypothetical protein